MKFIKDTAAILRDTFSGFSDDKVLKLSGSLAYSTLFSMGPLVVVIIAVCGLFLGRDAVEGKIYGELAQFMGSDTASQLQEVIKKQAVSGKNTVAFVIGIVTLVFGATSIFSEIQDSINDIWGLKPKPNQNWFKMVQNRLLSFSVIIGFGFLLLVSLAISTVIDAAGKHFQASFTGIGVVIFYCINQVITFSVITFIFAAIFKILPDADIKWRDVLTGAIVTAFLFMFGKFAISLYISKTNVGSTFGAAGSLVVMLVWIYYSSLILYLGAEFTKAYAIKYGSEIKPNQYTVTKKQIEIELGKQSIQETENANVVARQKKG